LRIFPAANEEVGTREHRSVTETEILRRVQKAFSKLVSNLKEANKKLIIVWVSEKLLKDIENHLRIHRKY
jgi:hypothetical protein